MLYLRTNNMIQAPQIEVSTKYIGRQEKPKETNVFVFSYTVNITNISNKALRLLSRYWLITNGDGEKVEIQGEGVVGEQPTIAPQQTFSYTSASMLKTEVGTMEGFYKFVSDDNEEIKAPIPVFSLAVPNSLH